jgi:hypothetical protein
MSAAKRRLCRFPDGRARHPPQMFHEILRLIAELRLRYCGYALSEFMTAYERTSLCVQFDKHLVAGHRLWKSFGKNEPHR